MARALQHRRTGPDAAARLYGAARSERMLHQHAAGRYDEDYYDMRYAFHMYYMDIKGDTVERMTEDELAAVHKKYWGY